MEFVKIYISNFWIWLGITIGGMIVLGTIISLIKELFKFLGILIRGYPNNYMEDIDNKEKNENIGKDLAEKIINNSNKTNKEFSINNIAKASADVGVKKNG